MKKFAEWLEGRDPEMSEGLGNWARNAYLAAQIGANMVGGIDNFAPQRGPVNPDAAEYVAQRQNSRKSRPIKVAPKPNVGGGSRRKTVWDEPEINWPGLDVGPAPSRPV